VRRESLAIYALILIAVVGALESGAPPQNEEGGERRTEYRTVVRDRHDDDGLDTQRRLDASSPGFATAVDLETDVGARPADALPEVLARTPGVNVRSIGGLGQFSSVSLRGSSGQQVAVFLDGVPLGGSFAGLVDLSEQPLDALTRVEVYRGHVPVRFGGAAMGGAINLVSRPRSSDGRVTVDSGIGSFDARQTRVAVVAPVRRFLTLGGRIGYAGARGDFPFLDTGTPQNPDDDTTEIRLNNHYDRVLTQLRLDGRRGPWRLAAQELVLWRKQGVPGPAGAQAREANLSTLDARTIASADLQRLGRPGGRLRWVFGLSGQRRLYADPANELMGANDQLTRGIDAFLSPRLRLALWRGAFLGLVADQRTEWVQVDERLGLAEPSGDATRMRLAYGAGLEVEQFLFERRWLIVPVLRVDALDSRFAVSAGEGEQDDEGRDELDVGFAPRLGTRVRVVPGLELRASGGRYFRPPTLLELFGDRGYVVGNEGLYPERGTSVDAGLVADLRLRRDAGAYAQIAGFFSRAENLIQWVNAGAVTRPENVEGARIAGMESSLDVRAPRRMLTLVTTYTLLDTLNLDGSDAPLPGRPRHDFFSRVSAGYEWIVGEVAVEPRVFYTFELVASTFLDPSARLELPTRDFHGLGAEVHLVRRVHAAVEVRNLLDRRTATVNLPVANASPQTMPLSDFIGYPLPGRTVWVTLRIDMELPRRARTGDTA